MPWVERSVGGQSSDLRSPDLGKISNLHLRKQEIQIMLSPPYPCPSNQMFTPLLLFHRQPRAAGSLLGPVAWGLA